MKIFNNKIILIIVLVIAAFLRIYNLNIVPPHLTPDEAALGYNAYSVLKTGKDEHGVTLPVVFKSFGDYKPGLYVYLTVPFVAVLGLNEWSVRLPSALCGLLSIYLLYLITKKLSNSKGMLPELVALIAATNPWLIYFSRGAWEVNLCLTLTLLGIHFFIKAFDRNKYLILSALFFALTLISYQGAKLSTGIVLLILSLIHWKEIWNIERKYIYQSVVVGVLVIIPILLSLFSGQAGRLEVFSVFSYPRSEEYVEKILNQNSESIGGVSYYLFHSESPSLFRGVLGRLFNHFSGRFLFFEGDWSNPRHSAPYQGVLLIFDLITLIMGLVFICRKFAVDSKFYKFILAWLVLTTLPAILSRDQVHAVRSFNMTIPLIVVCAVGLTSIISWIKGKKYSLVYYSLVVLFYSLSLVYFIDAYFVHLPRHSSKLWEYGYKQIVETVTPIQYNYKKVVVQQSFAQPYIYFLFFNKYDPAKYQLENSFTESEYKLDVGYVTKIDNIYFEAIDWSRNRGDHGSLFVADPLRIPPGDSKDEREFKLVKEIKYLDNLNTAFRIIEIKNK